MKKTRSISGAKIYYFCYDHQKPSGGQKQAYRHVDILNRNGYESYALHLEKGFRLNWFDNDTAVIDTDRFKTKYNPQRDFMVLPEDLGHRMSSFPGKKIIFNQGVYLGFYALGFTKPGTYPYLHPEVRGVFVVSDHNKEYLRFAYPGLKVWRVYNSADPRTFRYRPIRTKKRLIAASASKNPVDLTQVYHILTSRSEQGLNDLSDYDWVFIENNKESDVVDILQDSFVLLFLSANEGFGLMAIEAMLSGALVAAYGAGPLTEYLSQGNSYLSAKGDVLDVVRNMERIARSFADDGAGLQRKSKEALDKALEYSPQREERSVLAAWEQVALGEDASV